MTDFVSNGFVYTLFCVFSECVYPMVRNGTAVTLNVVKDEVPKMLQLGVPAPKYNGYVPNQYTEYYSYSF